MANYNLLGHNFSQFSEFDNFVQEVLFLDIISSIKNLNMAPGGKGWSISEITVKEEWN